MSDNKIFWDSILSYNNALKTYILVNREDDIDSMDIKEYDLKQVFGMFEELRSRANFHAIMLLVNKWDDIGEFGQVHEAIGYVGVDNASYFLAFIDCLSIDKKKGRLLS